MSLMCISTISIRSKHQRMDGTFVFNVPCGVCPECVKAKLSAWLFRLGKELEISSNPLFITLTYDEDNVPIKDGKKTLCKKDVQDFMKRLRKAYAKESSKKIRYYFVGEYGTKSGRPHYHAIMFNLDNPQLISQNWKKGFTYSPPLKNGGFKYVLKYISKPKTRKKDDVRLKEFSLIRLDDNE